MSSISNTYGLLKYKHTRVLQTASNSVLPSFWILEFYIALIGTTMVVIKFFCDGTVIKVPQTKVALTGKSKQYKQASTKNETKNKTNITSNHINKSSTCQVSIRVLEMKWSLSISCCGLSLLRRMDPIPSPDALEGTSKVLSPTGSLENCSFSEMYLNCPVQLHFLSGKVFWASGLPAGCTLHFRWYLLNFLPCLWSSWTLQLDYCDCPHTWATRRSP